MVSSYQGKVKDNVTANTPFVERYLPNTQSYLTRQRADVTSETTTDDGPGGINLYSWLAVEKRVFRIFSNMIFAIC
jgi:hypothetical protein